MSRATTPRKADRRTEILDAAQACFARSGFHQASMHDICAEAGMSPGSLYRYFPSKEAIIAGICERDRAGAAENLLAVRRAPSFLSGLTALARLHLERSDEAIGLDAEIMAESRRNPEIARITREIERDIKHRLVEMLQHAAEGGEIARDLDLRSAATVLMLLADGISWRRAVDPCFAPEKVLPLILGMLACMLGSERGGTHHE